MNIDGGAGDGDYLSVTFLTWLQKHNVTLFFSHEKFVICLEIINSKTSVRLNFTSQRAKYSMINAC